MGSVSLLQSQNKPDAFFRGTCIRVNLGDSTRHDSDQVLKGVIIRQKKPWRRREGVFIRFEVCLARLSAIGHSSGGKSRLSSEMPRTSTKQLLGKLPPLLSQVLGLFVNSIVVQT